MQLTEPRRVGEEHLGHLKINFKLQFGQTASVEDTLALHLGQIKPINPKNVITLQNKL